MSFRLETTRLTLRSFQQGDLTSFVAYRSDPEVARYQSWETPYSDKRAAEFFSELERTQPGTPGEWYQIAIEEKASGTTIGDCAFCVLTEDELQAGIGFTLATAYQGRGYATEAAARLLGYLFGDLSLHRVRANCDAENEPSWRLLERIGMRREAHLVEAAWFKGRWSTEYHYAILRREWESRGLSVP
jgi:RimJ/RimL family protein N-acetyltransferase